MVVGGRASVDGSFPFRDHGQTLCPRLQLLLLYTICCPLSIQSAFPISGVIVSSSVFTS